MKGSSSGGIVVPVIRLRSMLSALVVAAYLLAAFIPCEPALVFVEWTSGGAPHASAHPAGHGHGSAPQHHAAAGRSGEATGEKAEPVAGSRGAGAFCELELKPKCTCGCSESRATVGGSVSRLGAAVPGVHVGRLAEAKPAAALDLVHARARERHPEHDPIPI
jgi:hypothetical protein